MSRGDKGTQTHTLAQLHFTCHYYNFFLFIDEKVLNRNPFLRFLATGLRSRTMFWPNTITITLEDQSIALHRVIYLRY